MTLTPKRIESDFALIVAAEQRVERCPMSLPKGPLHKDSVAALCDEGRIRSEIFGKNYRVIFIIHGPHAGLYTALFPFKGAPFMVNGKYIAADKGGAHQRKIAP